MCVPQDTESSIHDRPWPTQGSAALWETPGSIRNAITAKLVALHLNQNASAILSRIIQLQATDTCLKGFDLTSVLVQLCICG